MATKENYMATKENKTKKKALQCEEPIIYSDVLRLVTPSSPQTSAQRSDHFLALVVSLCFERTNQLLRYLHVSLTLLSFACFVMCLFL